MAGRYQSARYSLESYTSQYQGWQACQQTKPAYYKANADAVNACQLSLEQARASFWVKLSKPKLRAFFVLAAVGTAIAGYLVTWLVVWLVGLCICGFIRCLTACRALCSRRNPENEGQYLFISPPPPPTTNEEPLF
jgi:hypothetical protein